MHESAAACLTRIDELMEFAEALAGRRAIWKNKMWALLSKHLVDQYGKDAMTPLENYPADYNPVEKKVLIRIPDEAAPGQVEQKEESEVPSGDQ